MRISDWSSDVCSSDLDLGGALHDQEGGESLALQPLTRIDDPGERAWAAEWLAAILGSEGVTVNPAAKEHLWPALGSLASAPPSERTLTGQPVLLQSQELKHELRPYFVRSEERRVGEEGVSSCRCGWRA